MNPNRYYGQRVFNGRELIVTVEDFANNGYPDDGKL